MATKKKSAQATQQPAAQPADSGEFRIVDLSQIRISKTNRKHFNETAMQELAANIREIGVAQPILIRPVTPTDEEPEPYEIVAGERRYRASKIAELKEIPAMIRQLDNLQAAKIQILENLQRENPHPLEEAEGYENLMLCHGYTADMLIAELKKSRSYIYGRLKLCALAKDLREDFLNDKFSASIALLVARIPVPELQVKAIAEITKPNYTGEAPSYRQAKEILQNRYMLDLSSAVFDIKDAKLLAIAGNCTNCPKRTGNQPEVFSDTDPNICTDPDCFAEKVAALNRRKIADANKNGIPVLEGEEAQERYKHCWRQNEVPLTAMTYHFYRVKNENTQYLQISQNIKKDQLPKPSCVLVMSDGKAVELYAKDSIQDILEKLGIAQTEEQAAAEAEKAANTPPSDAYLKKQEQDRILDERVNIENKFRYHLYSLVRNAVNVDFPESTQKVLTGLGKLLALQFRIPDVELAQHYGDKMPKSDDDAVSLIESDQNFAMPLFFDMILGNEIEVNRWSIDELHEDEFQILPNIARHFNIDPDQVRAEFEKPVDATPVKRPTLKLPKKVPAESDPWPFPRSNEMEGAA